MIFISHSSRDAAAAESLRQRILARGYGAAQVFLNSDVDSGIQSGSSWEQVLYTRLKDCRALILVCSQNWNESKWCFAEFVYAKAAGKEIFPLLIEPVDLGTVVGALQGIAVHAEGELAYDRLWKALDGRHLGPQDDFGWPPADGDDCPFPGLLAFDERLAGVYFGREPETQAALEELRRMRANGEPRLLMIVGGSGSGKSSLLKAGMLPRLKHKGADSEWLVLPTLRYGQIANQQQTIFDQLALNVAQAFPAEARNGFDWRALRTAMAGADAAAAAQAFVDAAQSLVLAHGSTDATVLLPLDQFEELLSPAAGQDAGDFLRFLKAVFSGTNGRLLAVATMRSDYLDVYERHPHALTAPSLLAWRLGMFPRDRVRDIVVKPAARAKVEIEPDLLDRLDRDTPSAEALPLLAFTLEKLYRRYADDRKIKLEEYEQLGGMEGAIENAAEGIASTLSPEALAVLRLAFVNHLAAVNSNDEVVRVTARWSDIPAAAQPILEQFVKERLLVKAEQRDANDAAKRWMSVEVAHEALFRSWPQLRDWLRTSADILRWRRDVERDRRSSGGAVVLTRAQLAVARSWPRTRRDELTPDEVRWIRRAVVRERVSYAIAAAIVLLIAGLGVAAWLQKRAAERVAQISLGRYLATQSAEIGETKMSTQALLLAVEAARRDSSNVVTDQLRRMIERTPPLIAEFKLPNPANAVQISPDGKYVAGGDAKGTLLVWDIRTREVRARASLGSRVKAILWRRPDQKQIAIIRAGDPNDELLLWDWINNSPPFVEDKGKNMTLSASDQAFFAISENHLTEWDPDGIKRELPIHGEHVAVSQSGGRIEWNRQEASIINAATGQPIGQPIRPENPINEAAISSDGQTWLTNSGDGHFEMWDGNGGGTKIPGGPYTQAVALGADRWLGEISSDLRKPGIQDFRLWHGADAIAKLSASTDRFSKVIFTDQQVVAVVGGLVRVFPLVPNAQPSLQFGPEAGIQDLQVENDRAATASDDGFVRIWELKQPTARTARDVVGGSASPNGDAIMLIGEEKSRIVRAGTGETIVDLGTGIRAAALSPDGHRVAAAYELPGEEPNQPFGWMVADVQPGSVPRRFLRGLDSQPQILSIAFPKDGDHVVVTGDRGEVAVLDLANGAERLVDADQYHGPPTLSPGGRFVVRAGNYREMETLRRVDGALIPLKPLPAGNYAFSRDDRYLAAWLADGTGAVWRTDTFEKISDFTGGDQDRPIPGLQFDPAGRQLAVFGSRTVDILDVKRREKIRPLGQRPDLFIGKLEFTYNGKYLAFTHDGQYLAISYSDNVIRIRRIADGELVATIPVDQIAETIAFTGDDGFLVVWPEGITRGARIVAWQRDQLILDACRLAARRSLTRDEWNQFLKGQPYRETCAVPGL